MAITDPESIRFANEQIRPLAESMRDLIVQLTAMDADVTRLLPGIPNDANEDLDDGRTSEGVSTLTGADIQALAAVRTAVLTLATTEVQALVAKACVRPLRVGG